MSGNSSYQTRPIRIGRCFQRVFDRVHGHEINDLSKLGELLAEELAKRGLQIVPANTATADDTWRLPAPMFLRPQAG